VHITHQLHDDSSTVANGQRRTEEDKAKFEASRVRRQPEPDSLSILDDGQLRPTVYERYFSSHSSHYGQSEGFPRAYIQWVSTFKQNTKLACPVASKRAL